MGNSVYKINKGINKSIEFKGLKAQYILYLGLGIIVLLAVFTVLYFLGMPTFICLAIVLGAGALLIVRLYAASDRYGEHGMMKMIASRNIPKLVRCNSRKVFKALRTTKR